uniref:Uncharacterized protein n=1 Tax=Candidatus Kentrum sp. MB TaxID=2138164 RepID=A0A450XDX8_9GAMM|nr:MAG: hypothetical protein BECKMB1821I_GA0114274_100343 [Candidatus Kentron sp. MB]VFK28617.1 MAG: hypothetical protein BECKMB1821G_GA0114241_103924 [Candidatus Kentron sp. MB]VFK74315.1 MAG: hypothetical protein BECKMB1821H_GA0114242_100343 [Candidatus Kentron sp. MB]
MANGKDYRIAPDKVERIGLAGLSLRPLIHASISKAQ